MPLEQELALFEQMKEELLKNHDEKFALIHDNEFVGAFDSAANAYEEGVKRFERAPFLVKRITRTEEIYRNQAQFLGLMNAHI